jgi:very-short-patch-repair endonuclease
MRQTRTIKHPSRRHALKFKLAACLRDSATDAERKLWSLLRSKQFAGLRFRRQQPIGCYIVDFYCSPAKLIIELDGEQHGEEGHARYDEIRTNWLLVHGYHVLRFSNVEFLKTPQIVLDGIAHVLDECAIPLPKPPLAV